MIDSTGKTRSPFSAPGKTRCCEIRRRHLKNILGKKTVLRNPARALISQKKRCCEIMRRRHFSPRKNEAKKSGRTFFAEKGESCVLTRSEPFLLKHFQKVVFQPYDRQYPASTSPKQSLFGFILIGYFSFENKPLDWLGARLFGLLQYCLVTSRSHEGHVIFVFEQSVIDDVWYSTPFSPSSVSETFAWRPAGLSFDSPKVWKLLFQKEFVFAPQDHWQLKHVAYSLRYLEGFRWL